MLHIQSTENNINIHYIGYIANIYFKLQKSWIEHWIKTFHMHIYIIYIILTNRQMPLQMDPKKIKSVYIYIVLSNLNAYFNDE